MTRDYPYTSDDLRGIANRMDQIEADIAGGFSIDDMASWKWLLKIDVIEPDGGEPAGQLRAHGDGWIGFYPRALTRADSILF